MADIFASDILDGTTLNCELTLSFKNRTADSVTVSYTAVTYLNASGYSGANYEEYSGKINISGSGLSTHSEEFIIKEKSAPWSGSAKHTVKGSFTLTLKAKNALYPKVTYTVTSSADSINSVYGSCSLTLAAYSAPVPENPASVTLSAQRVYLGEEINLSWSAASGASYYEIYQSVNGNAFTLCGQTEALEFTHIATGAYEDTVCFKVCACNSEGGSSGRKSAEVVMGGGLWLKREGKYIPCTVFVKQDGQWRQVKSIYVNKNEGWVKGL